MTTLVKIHRRGQMTLRSSFRAAMGVGEGSLVELSLRNGKTVITPKLVVDRSMFPTADDEYTPKQRRTIDRGISQSLREYKQGRAYGPFETHAAFIASLHKEAKKLGGNKPKRPAR